MNWPAISVGTPAAVLTTGLALALVLGAFGHHPLWPHQELNLSEAAALRDEAEVIRLIAHGEDPNDRREVRTGLLVGRAVQLTPLEAAVASERAEMVERLLANGAVMNAEIWNHLRCVARGDEVVRALEFYRPADAEMHCEGVVRPW